VNGKVLEATSFRPTGSGPFPGVLLIPGYQRPAKNYVPLGIRLAQDGFASVAVTQPGFGKSAGPPDFVGPKTIAALTEGYRKLRRESYVDPARLGMFGYPRGAMAAVFGAGIYDFQRAYDDSTLPGVRQNMLFPDREHSIGPEVNGLTVDFFDASSRRLRLLRNIAKSRRTQGSGSNTTIG
jgi:pimeloyl-ACP methyl ester carboxylesterase